MRDRASLAPQLSSLPHWVYCHCEWDRMPGGDGKWAEEARGGCQGPNAILGSHSLLAGLGRPWVPFQDLPACPSAQVGDGANLVFNKRGT